MARRETISSLKNPLLKEVRRALSRGSLTADGLCVAEGFHLLEEAQRSRLETPVVLASESVAETVERKLGRARGAKQLTVNDAVFAELSSTESAQGVMALVRPPLWHLDDVLRGTPLLVILDGVQDPGNCGAMARAAEAFGATGMLLLKGTVGAWNSKTLRASAGSLFRLPFVDGLDAATARECLTEHQVETYIAAPRGGLSLLEADLRRPTALVIGSEGRGVSPAMANAGRDLHIPVRAVESLNAAMAAGVLLYEAWRQRSLA